MNANIFGSKTILGCDNGIELSIITAKKCTGTIFLFHHKVEIVIFSLYLSEKPWLE